MRHEALSVPEGIDFDAQRRSNLAQRRKKLVYLPLQSPYIAAGNFGPGCRSVLAGKETTRLAFSIPRSAGSRWKKLRNGVDVGVRGIEGGRGVANDEGEAATAV